MKQILELLSSILFWRRELITKKEDPEKIKRIEEEMRATTKYINELVEQTKKEKNNA